MALTADDFGYMGRQLRMADAFTDFSRQLLENPYDIRITEQREILTDHISYNVRCRVAVPAPNQPEGNYNWEITGRSFSISRADIEDRIDNMASLQALIAREVEKSVDYMRERFEHFHNPPLTFQESRQIVRRHHEDQLWRSAGELTVAQSAYERSRQIEENYNRALQGTSFNFGDALGGLAGLAQSERIFHAPRYLEGLQEAAAAGRQAAEQQMAAIEAQRQLSRLGHCFHHSHLSDQELARRFHATWDIGTQKDTENHPGENSAMALLGEMIGAEQLEVYKKTKQVFVEGQRYDYIVPKSGMVLRLHKNRQEKFSATRLCIAIERKFDYPPTDNVIALIMMIQHCEKKFLTEANEFDPLPLTNFEAAQVPPKGARP